ncbi:MAG TPA: glycosyltransferase, partial [Cyclobacteriaceae bacterium]|nr:glycosyltransferase [Cyclobacteriaceae bacterium]
VGPLEQELDPLDAAALNYMHESNNIILTGFQKDVRPWLLASDVFVFPSYREGFPNVVMQAACMEIPCIVSDINGCNELIQHEESGLIVPPKNTEALQAAMEKLKNEAQLRIQFANKAADFVRTHFSQQYVWQALLEEYQVLLKQK